MVGQPAGIRGRQAQGTQPRLLEHAAQFLGRRRDREMRAAREQVAHHGGEQEDRRAAPVGGQVADLDDLRSRYDCADGVGDDRLHGIVQILFQKQRFVPGQTEADDGVDGPVDVLNTHQGRVVASDMAAVGPGVAVFDKCLHPPTFALTGIIEAYDAGSQGTAGPGFGRSGGGGDPVGGEGQETCPGLWLPTETPPGPGPLNPHLTFFREARVASRPGAADKSRGRQRSATTRTVPPCSPTRAQGCWKPIWNDEPR